MRALRFICDHCAEPIGVYEPVIVVVDGEVRETSRAAEPSVRSDPGQRYHRTCYLEGAGTTPS